MNSRIRLAVAGIGAVALLMMLIPAGRARMQRLGQYIPFFSPNEDEELLRPAVALRDAGWMRVLDLDAATVRGRGQLLVWKEQLAPTLEARIEGRIESFTSVSTPLAAGDAVLLFPETAGEQIPVRILRVDSIGDRSVLHLDWGSAQLPVTLRELVGH